MYSNIPNSFHGIFCSHIDKLPFGTLFRFQLSSNDNIIDIHYRDWIYGEIIEGELFSIPNVLHCVHADGIFTICHTYDCTTIREAGMTQPAWMVSFMHRVHELFWLVILIELSKKYQNIIAIWVILMLIKHNVVEIWKLVLDSELRTNEFVFIILMEIKACYYLILHIPFEDILLFIPSPWWVNFSKVTSDQLILFDTRFTKWMN